MKTTTLLFGFLISLSMMGQAPIPTDTYFSYPLDGNAIDIGGSNLTGTIVGGVTPTTDRFGVASGALQFDGIDGWIEIPYDVSIGTADFSVSYWANPNASNTGYVLTKEQNELPANQFRIGSTGDYFGCFSDNTNSYGGGLPYVPATDVWTFYTVTREANVIKLYVNGEYKSSLSTAATINHLNSLKYRVGVSYWGTVYYKGKVDDLRMFKHALSTNEIIALYNAGNPPKINTFAPTKGTVGTIVTISGSGFSDIKNENIVYFGFAKANVISSTNTSITIAVPEYAGSVVPITVTVKGNVANSTSSNTPLFDITNSVAPELIYSKYQEVVGIDPHSVAVGDFNRDGKADIAVANLLSSTVSILIGDGDGDFASASNYDTTGLYPYLVVTADFNGDGILDLATPDYGASLVSVFIGLGDGTFSNIGGFFVGNDLKIRATTGYKPNSLAVNDFNKDGKVDLVISNYSTSSVSVVMGNGDGTFTSSVQYDVMNKPLYVTTADFNKDGVIDLAACTLFSKLYVLLGEGNGTFKAATQYSVDGGAESIDVADMNGDGFTDIVTANGNNNIGIMFGNGDGTFGAMVNTPAGNKITCASIADVDGDGNVDVVATQQFDKLLTILFGNGNGTFSLPKNYLLDDNPSLITACDLNGDGNIDIINGTSSANKINISLNNSLSVKTSDVADIDSETATGKGVITGLGSSALTAYGVCWNTTGMPTISDNNVNNGFASTTRPFTAGMTGLLPNTKYYVKAYVTNSLNNVYYGKEVSFTTLMKSGVDNVTQSLLLFTPNPTTNGFTVDAGDQKSLLSIYDLSGSLMLTKQIAGKSYIDVTSLPSGIYVVKANGRIGKLVKK